MILERRNFMNFKDLDQLNFPADRQPQVEELKKLGKLYQLCEAGANEIGTKLENLDNEFQVNYDYNPIHHMEERMKSVQSLVNKVNKKGYDLNVGSVQEHISDIAGIRVITNYIDDIYLIEELLISQADVTLIKRKDYIESPKSSGYRSLHLVVSVPVFQSTGAKSVKVEIQIRTVGMDMWASLEHKLRYKTGIDRELVEQYGNDLQSYSTELFDIENKMQGIHQKLTSYKK